MKSLRNKSIQFNSLPQPPPKKGGEFGHPPPAVFSDADTAQADEATQSGQRGRIGRILPHHWLQSEGTEVTELLRALPLFLLYMS